MEEKNKPEHGGGATPGIFQTNTRLTFNDRVRHWGYRWGLGRMHASVEPGLYQVGKPILESPVLVSANYRMSFDILRSKLTGRNAWILVIDTKGINVWCAAGKGTFGTRELAERVIQHNLASRVSHREMIVPQLGAVGVAAHLVKKHTGFTVVYGPVRARDLPAFMETRQATPEMRRVTFGFKERMAVVPIELLPAFLWILLIAIGITLAAGWQAGLAFFGAGILALVVIPASDGWLVRRWLSIKGAVWGLLAGGLAAWLLPVTGVAAGSLVLSTTAVAAFLSLNFTGATTYTPVNGVKQEMRAMLPVIISLAGLALAGWIFIAVRRFV